LGSYGPKQLVTGFEFPILLHGEADVFASKHQLIATTKVIAVLLCKRMDIGVGEQGGKREV